MCSGGSKGCCKLGLVFSRLLREVEMLGQNLWLGRQKEGYFPYLILALSPSVAGECSRFSPARLPSFDDAKSALFLALILGSRAQSLCLLWVRQAGYLKTSYHTLESVAFHVPIL